MGLQDEEIKRLKDAAFFHDIGKVVMDDKMFDSEAVLTEQEEKDLQMHTVVGFRILNSFDDMMDLADSVLAHHEMWDGGGRCSGSMVGPWQVTKAYSKVERSSRTLPGQG